MIPSQFVQLDEIPLTSNGKVDKDSLFYSDLNSTKLTSEIQYVFPRNDVEKRLVEIFEEVLQVKGIGVFSDFFESGGNSIKGVKVLSQINKEFKVEVNIQNLFYTPTIDNLASTISFIQSQNKIIEESFILNEIEL